MDAKDDYQPFAAKDLDRVRLVTDILIKYGSQIRAMIRFVGCDPAEQEDAFQELFLSLLISPPPPDVKDMRSYLYKAILNDQINRSSTRLLHRRHLELYAVELKYMLSQGGPTEELEQLEELQKVYRVLEDLPPGQAKAVSEAFWPSGERRSAHTRMGLKRQSFTKAVWRGLSGLRRHLKRRMREHYE